MGCRKGELERKRAVKCGRDNSRPTARKKNEKIGSHLKGDLCSKMRTGLGKTKNQETGSGKTNTNNNIRRGKNEVETLNRMTKKFHPRSGDQDAFRGGKVSRAAKAERILHRKREMTACKEKIVIGGKKSMKRVQGGADTTKVERGMKTLAESKFLYVSVIWCGNNNPYFLPLRTMWIHQRRKLKGREGLNGV